MVQRFPKGLRVRSECIEQVTRAFVQHGTARREDLAEEAGLGLSTLQNFLCGKTVSRENFFKLCEILELDVNKIAVFGKGSNDSSPQSGERQDNPENVSISELATDSPKILLTGHRQHSTQAQQLSQALQIAGQAVTLAQNWLQQSDEELTQYDCFLLLVSNTSTLVVQRTFGVSR